MKTPTLGEAALLCCERSQVGLHTSYVTIYCEFFELPKTYQYEFNAKSSSISMKRGKQETRFRLKIDRDIIPTLTQQAIQCLGVMYDETCKDGESINTTVQLETWLGIIDWCNNRFDEFNIEYSQLYCGRL